MEEEEEEAVPGQSAAAPSMAIDCWENMPGPQLCFFKPVAQCLLMGPHTKALYLPHQHPVPEECTIIHKLSHQRGFGCVRLIYQSLRIIMTVEREPGSTAHGLTLLPFSGPPF